MKRGDDRQDEARRRARRQRIAFEAARLMATQGVRDSAEAARRAARQLGEDAAHGLPEHTQVLDQLREYQRLFQRDTQPQALRARREAALQAMQFLAAFEPRLVGAVLDGSADANTPVSLQVFSDDPEAFARLLAEQGWPVTTFDQRLRPRRGQAERFPAWRFLADGLPFEIVALPMALLRQAPLAADGRPMARASAAALREKMGSEAFNRDAVPPLAGPAGD
jgi:hypothetical protein